MHMCMCVHAHVHVHVHVGRVFRSYMHIHVHAHAHAHVHAHVHVRVHVSSTGMSIREILILTYRAHHGSSGFERFWNIADTRFSPPHVNLSAPGDNLRAERNVAP
jgi:hypothetical protein